MPLNLNGVSSASYPLAEVDKEIERLGFQHEVWASGSRDLWRRGGVSTGAKVLDAGCGPGFATLELAEIVGNTGQVSALDGTEKYLHHLRKQIVEKSLQNVSVVEGKVEKIPLPDNSLDFIFTRFLFLYIPDLKSVVAEFFRVLRPGGKVLATEFSNIWQVSPPLSIDKKNIVFPSIDMEVGRVLPSALCEGGFQLESIVPEARVGLPDTDEWK